MDGDDKTDDGALLSLTSNCDHFLYKKGEEREKQNSKAMRWLRGFPEGLFG